MRIYDRCIVVLPLWDENQCGYSLDGQGKLASTDVGVSETYASSDR